MASQEEIIQNMTYTARELYFHHEGDENIMNCLIFHVMVGSHMDAQNPFIARNAYHEFPLLAERLILNPTDTFSSGMMHHILESDIDEINIYQQILLIDPLYDALLNPVQVVNSAEEAAAAAEPDPIMMPKNLIDLLERVLPPDARREYTFGNNFSIIHEVELAPGIIVKIDVNTEFMFFPISVKPNLLENINSAYPALNTLFPNILICYFDMSGQKYDNSPFIITESNPAIYTLLADCMLNFDDPITVPFLHNMAIRNGEDNIQWYHINNYLTIDDMRFAPDENPNIIRFARRFYDYFYRDNLIPVITGIFPYIIGKSAYHISKGMPFELNNIPLIPYGMDEFLDRYLIPLIQYRVGIYNNNYSLIIWYLNKFRNLLVHRRVRAALANAGPIRIDGPLTLLKFITSEMQYLSVLHF